MIPEQPVSFDLFWFRSFLVLARLRDAHKSSCFGAYIRAGLQSRLHSQHRLRLVVVSWVQQQIWALLIDSWKMKNVPRRTEARRGAINFGNMTSILLQSSIVHSQELLQRSPVIASLQSSPWLSMKLSKSIIREIDKLVANLRPLEIFSRIPKIFSRKCDCFSRNFEPCWSIFSRPSQGGCLCKNTATWKAPAWAGVVTETCGACWSFRSTWRT